jgi:hypothetical protein
MMKEEQMEEEPWSVRRMRELEAAAPIKRKKRAEPFVKLELWWAEAVAKATADPGVLVWVELLRMRWTTKRTTFPLPNGKLKKLGVSRDVKRRVLADLVRAQLISIEQHPRKAPIVTMNLL